MATQFEQIFDRFVESIGGEVIPKSDVESADFLFRADKIVAELKTLERDARDEHVRKLLGLAQEWDRRGQVRVIGRAVLSLRKIHPQAQREWLDLLEAPIEGIARKANRQIRSTTEADRLPCEGPAPDRKRRELPAHGSSGVYDPRRPSPAEAQQDGRA
jgi:hypothetical protein